MPETLGHDGADLLIAATALEHGLTVVTRNVRHFEPAGVRYAESGRVLRGLPAGIAWPLLPACRRGAELTVHPSGPGPRPRRTCLSTDSHLAVYKDCFWVFGVVIRTNLIALHGLTLHPRGRRGTRRRTCRRAIDVLLVQR